MRRRRGSELASGILALVATGVALWGYFWFTGQSIGRRGNSVMVELSDAGGLQRGDRVRLAGVQVGTVRRVGLQGGRVRAEMVVDPDLDLPSDSRAALRASGAFGGRYLELVPGRAGTRLEPGDTLPSLTAPSLAETFATVGDRANEVLSRAAEALSPANVASVEQGGRALRRSLIDLAAMSVSLRTAAEALHRRISDPRLDSTAAKLAVTAGDLTRASTDFQSAASSLASILKKVDQGEGTLGRAVNDPTLYEALLTAAAHMDEAARSANQLVGDVRARPGRFVKVSLF